MNHWLMISVCYIRDFWSLNAMYNPHMTKLLQQAQQAGCKTIDGYGMLLWQGAEQFTLWTGKDFPLEYVKQVMGFGA